MSLIIRTNSRKEENFLKSLLSKLGIASQHVSQDEIEDFYFTAEMKKNKKDGYLKVEEARAAYKKLVKRK